MKKGYMKAAAAFFILMAVFTLLSRVVYNMGTIAVRAEEPESITIKKEIEGTGVVSGKTEQAVVTTEGLLIKKVFVKEGESVEKDDILFQLDGEYLKDKITEKEQELKQLQLQIQDAKNAVYVARQSRELSISQAQSDYDKTVADGDSEVAEAKSELETARSELEAYQNSLESHSDQNEEELKDIVKEKEDAYNEAVKNRENSIYEAQKAVDTANLKEAEDSTVEQNEIQEERIQKELNALTTLQKAEGKITSTIAGTVTSVAVKAGDTTSGTGDILIMDASEGVELNIVFSDEYREYLTKGKNVTVTSLDSTKEAEEKLQNLLIDSVTSEKSAEISAGDGTETGASGSAVSDNAGVETADGEITVTVEIPDGTLNIGNTATLKIILSEETYDTCVPISALHQKEKGKYYVNVIDNQKSVMGDAQIVRSVDVELLDRNDKYAAVEGLALSQEVITETSEEVQEGTRVVQSSEE